MLTIVYVLQTSHMLKVSQLHTLILFAETVRTKDVLLTNFFNQRIKEDSHKQEEFFKSISRTAEE